MQAWWYSLYRVQKCSCLTVRYKTAVGFRMKFNCIAWWYQPNGTVIIKATGPLSVTWAGGLVYSGHLRKHIWLLLQLPPSSISVPTSKRHSLLSQGFLFGFLLGLSHQINLLENYRERIVVQMFQNQIVSSVNILCLSSFFTLR
jgi:hypothetical protein